jgi:hypothetical protein
LEIDAMTLEIRVIEVTDNRIDDISMLPKLLGKIPVGENIPASAGIDEFTLMTSPKMKHAAVEIISDRFTEIEKSN